MQLRSALSHLEQVILPDLLTYARNPTARWAIAAAAWLYLMSRVFGRRGELRRRFFDPVDLVILGVLLLVTWYVVRHRWW